MIIQPKIRGFICTAAHPIGCEQVVNDQINYVKQQNTLSAAKKVLVIGSSTGYGLASRIVAAIAAGADTIGVSFERPASDKRTATAGWYNTSAFETIAAQMGLYAKSINGDAFSNEIKRQTADLIREHMKEVDLLVYSVASPRRTDPQTGETFTSTLKPIDNSFTSKTVDPMTGEVKEITLEPASEQEIMATEKVMGGADWELWIDFLLAENLLSSHAKTVAFSYIGPELTYPIYKEGTIGRAKQHLVDTTKIINNKLAKIQGSAYISVNKALVTQASSAIPVVPLYMALLFKIMKVQGTHEGCIEQIYRLFKDHLYSSSGPVLDENGLIRLDNFEMLPDVQKQILDLWQLVNSENINQLSDIKTYRDEFYRLFGFGLSGIDYQADIEQRVNIPSIPEQETV